eukprot:TRINITY_DN12715_c0_g1_i13.p1 TRINITY_DN12715_c0_g1~~TRINITY_DN12715_c0_g1_i13.p1  ORF type:complete len:699 (+),score=84.09 TRINITY_DN12715_c0_g1_i13:134-2098(+)
MSFHGYVPHVETSKCSPRPLPTLPQHLWNSSYPQEDIVTEQSGSDRNTSTTVTSSQSLGNVNTSGTQTSASTTNYVNKRFGITYESCEYNFQFTPSSGPTKLLPLPVHPVGLLLPLTPQSSPPPSPVPPTPSTSSSTSPAIISLPPIPLSSIPRVPRMYISPRTSPPVSPKTSPRISPRTSPRSSPLVSKTHNSPPTSELISTPSTPGLQRKEPPLTSTSHSTQETSVPSDVLSEYKLNNVNREEAVPEMSSSSMSRTSSLSIVVVNEPKVINEHLQEVSRTTATLVTAESRKFARGLPTTLPLSEPVRHLASFEMNDEAFDEYFKLPTHVKIDFSIWTQKRDKVAFEILSSELTYVRNLHILNTIFRPQLVNAWNNSEWPIALNEKLHNLFKNIESIISINSILLSSLANRFENWSDEQVIGDVLNTMSPFLKIYKVYSNLYGECTLAMQTAEKNREFNKVLEMIKTHPLSRRQSLGSFLIIPVQRVPRYVLLLQDLLKCTSQAHPDYEALSVALHTLQAVASGIDESISIQENVSKCMQIQALFPSAPMKLVVPHRRFVYEGLLTKQCRKERKQRMFFLFNDILIYGIPLPGGRYYPSCVLTLVKTLVSDVVDDGSLMIKNAIQIQGTGKSFYLFFESQEEKVKWLTIQMKF